MSLGAIITVPVSQDTSSVSGGNALLFGRLPALWDVLGRSAHQRMIDLLHNSGVQEIAVIPETAGDESPLEGEGQTRGFWREWETRTARLVKSGLTHLLLMRAGAYAELDFNELLSFHAQRPQLLTSVHDAGGSLDILLASTQSLSSQASYRAQLGDLLQSRRRFRVNGYTNHLSNPEQFRGLAKDALLGRCAIRPYGKEVQPGIWVGKDVELDRSATMKGPLYVGDEASIGPSCKVSNAAVIERGAVIDFGTDVNDSSVLPNTYVGAGLALTGCVAGRSRIYHLQRGVEVRIRDNKLIGDASRMRDRISPSKLWFSKASDSSGVEGLSTTCLNTASLIRGNWRLTNSSLRTRGRREVPLVSSSRNAPWEKP